MSWLTKHGPVAKVERLPHCFPARIRVSILKLLGEECDDAINMGLHAGHCTGRPVLGYRLLHTSVLGRTHFAEYIVPDLFSHLKTTDSMPFRLLSI